MELPLDPEYMNPYIDSVALPPIHLSAVDKQRTAFMEQAMDTDSNALDAGADKVSWLAEEARATHDELSHLIPLAALVLSVAYQDINDRQSPDGNEAGDAFAVGAGVAYELSKESFNVEDLDHRMIDQLNELEDFTFSEWRVLATFYGLQYQRMATFVREMVAPLVSVSPELQVQVVEGAGFMYYVLALRHAQIEHENNEAWQIYYADKYWREHDDQLLWNSYRDHQRNTA